MKKITFSLITITLLHIVFVQSIQSQSLNRSEIDEFILQQMDVFHVPGLSACIVIGDSVVWNKNYGYMNLEDSIQVTDSTLFNVFSIGKSLTATCVMMLWDNQLLGLDQSINDFLPFQIINPWNNADSITARMLMAHSAGIKDLNFESYIQVGDPTESLAHFAENYFVEGGEYYSIANYYSGQPGTYFHYSNFGSALNGFLVEPLTGISFNQFAQDSLLTPLEMFKSAWFLGELNLDNLAIGYSYVGGNFIAQPHYGMSAYPGVSHRSTALELSNFVIMLLNNGVYKNKIVLSEAAVDSMKRMQNPNWVAFGTACLGMFQRDDYGNRIVWGHNGGSDAGYAAHYYFCPAENSGIVITTNSEQYIDPVVEYMFDYALTITNTPEKAKTDFRQLNIYPNPTNSSTKLSGQFGFAKSLSIYLYNTTGICMKSWEFKNQQSGKQEFTLDLSNLPPGIYFLRLQAGNRSGGEEGGEALKYSYTL